VATEISPAALAVARENAAALGARVELLQGDLDAPVPPGDRFDVVVSNPPYVPGGEIERLSREVRGEPRLALDGGADGLDLLRRIVSRAPSRLRPGSVLLLEMHESHATALPALCREAGLSPVEVGRDLAGLPRWVVARLPPAA
jgi:release factor glutamine methyltransferase